METQNWNAIEWSHWRNYNFNFFIKIQNTLYILKTKHFFNIQNYSTGVVKYNLIEIWAVMTIWTSYCKKSEKIKLKMKLLSVLYSTYIYQIPHRENGKYVLLKYCTIASLKTINSHLKTTYLLTHLLNIEILKMPSHSTIT